MCRLYGFHANELTKVECSLVRAQNALLAQSRRDVRGRQHADGWGIACYGDQNGPGRGFPGLVRHETAAFRDIKFNHQAETVYAETVVAHVRLATVGTIGSQNSHPFCHDFWTFAHNGTLPGFDRLKNQLAIESERFQNTWLGSTDSEQFFHWLLNRMLRDGIDLTAPDDRLVQHSVSTAVQEMDQRCRELEPEKTPKLTFVLTNGRLIMGCCWNNTLYCLDRKGVHDCEICGIPHIRHDESTEYRAVVFASEPITDEAWKEVPNQSLAVVNDAFQWSATNLTENV